MPTAPEKPNTNSTDQDVTPSKRCRNWLAGGNGCVFSLNTAPPQPRVLGLSVAGNSNVVQFAGTPAIQYDVQRSTDLASWFVLATISAPVNGSFSHTDLNPPQRAAFYQLRQH